MSELTETDFETANAHLIRALGMDLKVQLTSNRWSKLTAWSIITPLIALWRYSQLLDENIKIYDLVAEGHKSHLSGTDLDFGYASEKHRKKAVHQMRIVNDMLELKDAMVSKSSKITSFRLGFYFDRFDNDDNLNKLKAASDKAEKFTELYNHRTGVSSMHLGLRYDYMNDIYHGNTLSAKAGKFAFWGQGSEGFHRSKKWGAIFRDMDGNLPKGQIDRLASTILQDFQTLDLCAPNVAYGRVDECYDPGEPVWV